MKASSDLTAGHSHTHLADLLFTNLATGKTAAFDISVTPQLKNTHTLIEAGVSAGSAALATESRKHRANDAKCGELGWLCVPLVAETYGAWGNEANRAKENAMATPTRHESDPDPKKTLEYAVKFARLDTYGQACHTLHSDDIALNNDSTWQMIIDKHPSCSPPPIPDVATCTPLSNFDMAAILRSFPRGIAAGPSGLRIQISLTSLCLYISLFVLL